jgi:hypothetical protein
LEDLPLKEQLEYIERASRVLESARDKDKELREHAQRYLSQLPALSQRLAKTRDVTALASCPWIELCWRTHMQAPLSYAQAVVDPQRAWSVGELVAAIRRQEGFMSRAREGIEIAQTEEEKAQQQLHCEYVEFLRSISEAKPEKQQRRPSLEVDLAWHAHMQCPWRYSKDCSRLVGCLVDHDDHDDHDDRDDGHGK